LKFWHGSAKADPTVSLVLRNKILKLACNGIEEPHDENRNSIGPRIYSRDEVAQLLGGKSTRYVDQLARRGLLQKFIPRGIDGRLAFAANHFTPSLKGIEIKSFLRC